MKNESNLIRLVRESKIYPLTATDREIEELKKFEWLASFKEELGEIQLRKR